VTKRISVLGALRACGVTFGPSLMLDLAAAAGTVTVVTGRLRRPRRGAARLLAPLAVAGAALPWLHLALTRPWLQRWGATDAELAKPLPGDELVPNPAYSSTRAITVDAPVAAVWPWLAQIGQDRGGFYSYEWLENLAGCEMRNADRVHPEWQHRATGDIVLLHPTTGLRVAHFEPNRAIVLEGWGAFVVEPIDANTTRVILRSRTPRGWTALLHALLVEIPHFLMERKMLLGLKERAARAAPRASAAARSASPPPA
jgi:hypothetical protein